MSLVVIGINHKLASLEFRERWTYNSAAPEQMCSNLQKISSKFMSEVAILSTCNRTEIYCYQDNNNQLSTNVYDWFLQEITASTCINIKQHGYLLENNDAIKHMIRVASGLDSMVIGEPQIFGQFKQAYNIAKQANTINIGKNFDYLFKHVIKSAKNIRTNTDISLYPVSIASIAVDLLADQNINNINILLIGSGDINTAVARSLLKKINNNKLNKVNNIDIISRNLSNAKKLSDFIINHDYTGYTDNINIKSISNNLDSLTPEYLANYNVIFAATSSDKLILDLDIVKKTITAKNKKNLDQSSDKLYLIDLALPRDICPQCSELDINKVQLYNIDDLNLILANNTKQKLAAAEKAEKLVEKHSVEFISWENSLLAMSSICSYRQQAEEMCQDVIEKSKKKLAAGHDPEEVLISALNLLRNKLLHHPTVTLKNLHKEHEENLDKVKDLLNL